jgi:hypothetical protein
MKREGWADYPFSFHDGELPGPAILSKIAKKLAFSRAICECGAPAVAESPQRRRRDIFSNAQQRPETFLRRFLTIPGTSFTE